MALSRIFKARMISLRVNAPRRKMSFITLRAYLFDETIGKAL